MMASPLHDLRERLGGDVYDGGRRWLGPGPGHSRHDRSLAVMVSPDGRLIFHSFAGDATRDCFDHLGIERDETARAKPSDFREMMKRREREQQAERRRKIAFCEAVWSETLPGEGSPVGDYLRSHRDLPISSVPTSLRFHPSAPTCYPWSERQAPRTPAMVALVTDACGSAWKKNPVSGVIGVQWGPLILMV
jgi:putative DNA primase/helicase